MNRFYTLIIQLNSTKAIQFDSTYVFFILGNVILEVYKCYSGHECKTARYEDISRNLKIKTYRLEYLEFHCCIYNIHRSNNRHMWRGRGMGRPSPPPPCKIFDSRADLYFSGYKSCHTFFSVRKNFRASTLHTRLCKTSPYTLVESI